MRLEFGGNVIDVDEKGKTKLAYEIQKMTEAWYYFIKFEAEGDVPAQVEDKLRIQENIIAGKAGVILFH